MSQSVRYRNRILVKRRSVPFRAPVAAGSARQPARPGREASAPAAVRHAAASTSTRASSDRPLREARGVPRVGRRAVEAADTAEAKVAKQARPQKSSEEREQGRTARRKAIADAGAAKTQAHQAASREKVEAKTKFAAAQAAFTHP